MDIGDVLAHIDTHLHQQDLYLKQQDERLGRQDRILELQTEQIRLMQLSLQQHGQTLEQVAHHSLRLAEMVTAQTALVARAITVLDRLEHRLAARPEEA